MDSFYRAFEDRYRGSRELIKSRLAKYAPFFQSLAALYPGAKTFDLGCGRGEWLELMSEAGFDPTGADLDADMLEACRERNLPAIQGDAIEHLASLESNSCALISAFHVVEHVSFEQLRRIVDEALRVLMPGGLLIIETPNPENLAVATSNFFLDPSHQKPIPALLLSFVAEHAGFDRVKVVRLQESPELRSAAAQIHLLDVVGGASPDYAIVAQKDADSTQGAFDDVFGADYGLTFAALASRYDAKLESSIAQLGARVSPIGDRLQSVEGRLGIAEGRLQLAEGRLQLTEERFRFADEQRERSERLLKDMESRALRAEDLARQASTQVVEEQLHHAEDRYQLLEGQLERTAAMLRDAEARVQQANAHLQAVYRSTSWHVTAPMRWVSLGLRGNAMAPARRVVKSSLQSGAQYASSRPWLRWLARTVLNQMPRTKARLVPIVAASMSNQPVDTTIGAIRVEDLDEHANRIHATLIADFDRLQREKN